MTVELQTVVSKHSDTLDSLSDKLVEVMKTMVLLVERDKNMADKQQEISAKIDQLAKVLDRQSEILNKVGDRISKLEDKRSFGSAAADFSNKYWKVFITITLVIGFVYTFTKDDLANEVLKNSNSKVYIDGKYYKLRHKEDESS